MTKIKTGERLVAGAAAAAVASVLGYAAIENGKAPEKADAQNKATTVSAAEGISHLEALMAKHPNIISVKADPLHPELEAVTYEFTPGHNTIGHFALDVAPNQVGATDVIKTYNNGLDLVKYGTDDALTADVDPTTGMFVTNPNSGTDG